MKDKKESYDARQLAEAYYNELFCLQAKQSELKTALVKVEKELLKLNQNFKEQNK